LTEPLLEIDGRSGERLRKAFDLDVGAVYAYADAFAHAVLDDDEDVLGNSLLLNGETNVPDLVASYFSEKLKGNVVGLLRRLPRPLDEAEILSVTPPLGSSECVSVTRFSGPQEGVLFRAVWIESENQLRMEAAQIVECTVR
jgi:hypothetical protein